MVKIMITIHLKDGNTNKYFLCSNNYADKIISCGKDKEKVEQRINNKNSSDIKPISPTICTLYVEL
jgi:hypothetical protein